MATNFDALFAALGGQESGGNYGATNGRTGASGKYQIMPGNVAAWGKQYLGQNITLSQYKSDPALQEKLARAVFQSYYTKYGDRGALSAWYSGQPGKANNYTKFRANEPSVGEYVDSVLKRAGSAGGGGMTSPLIGSVPNEVVDNTAKESAIESLVPTSGDPYGMMAASIGAGNTAPGIEAGSRSPGFDAVAASAQGSAAQKAAAQAIPSVMDEGTYNQLAGIGTGDTTGKRAAIIALGKQYLGTMYKWGGAAPGGFDCSGLLYYIFKENGITLPRVSFQQATSGKRTALSDLKAGDLVAWDNSPRNPGADHIALYLGNGQILEAPKAGVPVRIRSLGKSDAAAWGVQMNY
ncbi:C40 family peptidase [Kineococcus sp. NPDC059986]|uniref:C40 family peptidase n=1 Tax=Kineococcus sp. NPDC059986 TaxID=3155538 RepID=UPI00344FB25F